MPSKERAADRGARIARTDLLDVGRDIRTNRVGAGLSLKAVGRAVGLSYSQVGRIERGIAPNASARHLARMGAVVGLDVRIRAYPGGPPIRDAAQVALLERLRSRLHPGLRLVTEVPVVSGSLHEMVGGPWASPDQRAWDGVIRGGGETAVEAVTRFNDLQAVLRRTALKLRDGLLEDLILLVADTRGNRAAIRSGRLQIDDRFPVPARVALAELAAGRHPGGSALVFL